MFVGLLLVSVFCLLVALSASCSLSFAYSPGLFLNLPLGANFYNSTDLSHTTTDFRTSTQPQLAVEAGWGLAYLAGPYWMTSTCGWGRFRPVEASWGRLRPVEARLLQPFYWAGIQLYFDLHSEHSAYQFMTQLQGLGQLRSVEASLPDWNSVRFWPSQWEQFI